MPFELQTDEDSVKLILVGTLGVRHARPLWEAMQPALAAGTAIRVEAPESEKIDTSIVQILCRLSAQTGKLQIGAVSDSFLAALERRGLQKFFMQAPTPSQPNVVILQPQEAPKRKPNPASRNPRRKHA